MSTAVAMWPETKAYLKRLKRKPTPAVRPVARYLHAPEQYVGGYQFGRANDRNETLLWLAEVVEHVGGGRFRLHVVFEDGAPADRWVERYLNEAPTPLVSWKRAS